MAKKQKTDLETFEEFVDWFYELMWGEPRRPKKSKDNAYWGDIGSTKKPTKRKRARKKDGTYRGDDKSTPNVNEAWEKK